MQKHLKYTSVFLLMVVLYPFLFQSLHIIYHDHHQGHSCNGEVIHGSLNYCLSPSGSCGQPPGQASGTGHGADGPACRVNPATTGHAHDECPLCEHEFAKFNLKRTMNIFFSEEILTMINTSFYQNPKVLYTGNHISPRAPPRLC